MDVGDGFVGRERHLAELDVALARTRTGRGEMVLMAGEPGIGKTSLAEVAADRARASGMAVAWAQCSNAGAAPAFWPWTQLLRGVLVGGAAVVTAPSGATLASLLPNSQRHEDGRKHDPEQIRLKLFDAVTSYIRSLARDSPLLLILEDLHWADAPSIRLLTFVAPMLRTMPVAVIGTYRDTETGSASLLGEALPELIRHGRKLSLLGLTAEEIRELVATFIGSQPRTQTAAAVHRHTGGNPLFARELVRLLDAKQELERFVDGGMETDVPEGVRAVIGRRLARLSDQCRAALCSAAVIGQEFTLEALETVMRVESWSLLERLDEAIGARLVSQVGVGRYGFPHALIREVAYGELPLARRVRLHQQVGEVLQAWREHGRAIDPSDLAHHFLAAAPGGNAPKAVQYAMEAGDRAMATCAYEDAVRLYKRALEALELAPSSGDHAGLLLSLADALVAAGDVPRARETYQQAAVLARAAGSAAQLGRAALGMGSGPAGFEVSLLDRPQIELLEEVLAALGDEDSALRAWVMARLSVALSYTDGIDRRLALSEKAVKIARRVDDAAALGYALSAHCDAIAGPADCERRQEESAEIIRLARQLGDRRMELLGRRMRMVVLLELGDIGGADAEIEAYSRLAEAVRQPLYHWYLPLWRGMRALMAGRLDEAARWAADAESIGKRAHSENAAVLSGGLRFFTMRERGEFEEVDQMLHPVMRYMADLGIQACVAVALSRAGLGRLAEARGLLDRAAGELDRAQVDSEWPPMMVQLTETVAAVGGHPMAEQLYGKLLPYRSRFAVDGIGATYHGSLERHLGVLAGLLGRREAAEDHFVAALAANKRLGGALLIAHTHRDAGRTLGEQQQVVEALAIYRELGLEYWEREMERWIGSVGEKDPLASSVSVFRKVGELWTISFGGRAVNLKDAKGLRDLAQLLAQPGREIHVLDLARGSPHRELREHVAAAQGLRIADDAEQVIDSQARDAYKARLMELEAELEEADAAADAERSVRIQEERDAVLAQLTGAYGLGGRVRRRGSLAERARSAVTWRIRDALGRVEAVHPPLGRHLRRSIKTGTFCVYDPDESVTWAL